MEETCSYPQGMTAVSGEEKANVLTISHDCGIWSYISFPPFFLLTFKFYLFICYVLIFGSAGSLLGGLFSSCSEQKLCFNCSMGASHRSSLSCCRAWGSRSCGLSNGSLSVEH